MKELTKKELKIDWISVRVTLKEKALIRQAMNELAIDSMSAFILFCWRNWNRKLNQNFKHEEIKHESKN